MANEIKTEITLDIAAFTKALKDAENKGKESAQNIHHGFLAEVGEHFFGELGGMVGNLAPAVAVATFAFEALKKSIEGVFVAENIERANKQLDILSEKAGLSSQVLIAGLEKASGGLIGTGDLIASANKALVELGSSAENLPEIMDIARKSVTVFGGDTLNTFEQINSAIATGNTRSLRQIGIYIDQEKAVKDYARSLGVSVDTLTLAGRQQAVLNAVLDKGTSAFQDINLETNTATESWVKFKVAMKDLIESFQVAINTFLNGPMKDFLNALSTAANLVSSSLVASFGSGIDQMKARQKELNLMIAEQEEHIKSASQSQGFFATLFGGTTKENTDLLAKLKTELQQVNGQIQESIDKQKEMAADSASGATASPLFNAEKVQKDSQAYNEAILRAQEETVNLKLQGDLTQDQLEQLSNQQKLLTQQQFEIDLSNMKRQYLDTNLVSKEQFHELEIAMEERKNARLTAMQQQALQQQKMMTQAFQSGIVNVLSSSFAALGRALVTGADLFKAFAAAALNAFGQMLITIGTQTLAAGLLMSAVPILFGLQGAAAVAAGAGMIIAGGVLQGVASSLGGGGSFGASAPAGGGGGVATGGVGGGGFASELSPQFAENKPGTSVNVIVQGNVLDRRQTGLELADVINEAFGSNGVTYATA